MNGIGFYIHIPFCRAKCAYCDFNSYAGLESLFEDYVLALIQEIQIVSGELQPEADSVYLGGGTPTVLPATLLTAILQSCGPAEEITVEANPGTLTPAYLTHLLHRGVNRLSLGVQSLDDDTLRLLGRIHSADQARDSYRLARQAGFDNVNLDFIYALPGQTLAGWRETLQEALELAPDHLSLYALALQEDTPLAARIAGGKLPPLDDDLAADMYLLAEEMLEAAGYLHYEISNWAQEGRLCQHNLKYWRNEPYLGFGAGAHSCCGGRRWANVVRPEEYLARLSEGRSAIAAAEEIDPHLAMAETMILGLRLTAGVSFDDFRQRFGCALEAVYGEVLTELAAMGLLELDGSAVQLTGRGRLLGNEVFERFL